MSNRVHLAKEFEVKGGDAQHWLQQATKLRMSANVVRVEFDKYLWRQLYDPQPYTEEYRISGMAFMESYMMLTGMSFECLRKGIDVAANPKRVADGKLDRTGWERSGHDLSKWAASEKLSPERVDLLSRLEEYVVWAGKYPIPTNIITYAQAQEPENKQKFHYPSDFALIDKLFEELSEKLVEVWSVIGAPRW